MADTSSVKGKSDSSKDVLLVPEIPDKPHNIFELEERELAKHHLRHLKDSFEDYVAIFNNYLHRYYLILALCSVVTLMGAIIVFLKIVGKESLLNSFKTIQSSFASLVSGGSIIAFGSSILYAEKKEAIDDTKYEPREEAIRLCIERNLGEKLDDTINKLLKKKDDLEIMRSLQSIIATISSIFILFLVGIDFFGFLPDIKYIDIGLDGFISLMGLYFFGGACSINSVLPDPKKKLPKQNIITLIIVTIPCAFLVGLTKRSIFEIYFSKINSGDWMEEVYLTTEERDKIKCLLHGLNKDLISKRAVNFCKELIPEKSTEKSRLIAQKPNSIEFIESVNKIESETKQKVLIEYFSLGEALAERLKGYSDNIQKKQGIKKIVDKFPSTETEEICNYYIELEMFERGLTLNEFFYMFPQKMQDLSEAEISIAHDALKVYSIFNKIGRDKIKQVKTFSASSIGEFTRNEINRIINEFKHVSYSPNNMLNV